MAQVATTKNLSALTSLLQSPSWQTFLTIAEEQGESVLLCIISRHPLFFFSTTTSEHLETDIHLQFIAPSVPSRDYPNGSSSDQPPQTFDDGFEIPPDVDVPPEVYEQQADQGGDVDMDAGGGGAGGGGGGGGGGNVVCPHCTFENEPGSRDCDVCGLPIA